MTELRQKRVLLVDDNANVRDCFSALLTSLGGAVVTAKDGVQGLAMFLSDNFDVVLTDLDMPRMRGDELARLIKAADPLQRVIMVTGSIEEVGGAPSCVDGIVQKPCTVNGLIDALNGPHREMDGLHVLAA